MDPVHVHLFLNHVPIVGSFAAVLLLAYAAIRKSDEVMRVGLVGAGVDRNGSDPC